MTSEQAVEELKDCQCFADPEEGHIKADDVLCKLLIALGHQAVVDEWEKVHKYYS